MEDLAYPLPIGSIVKYEDWEQLLMNYGRHQKKVIRGLFWITLLVITLLVIFQISTICFLTKRVFPR